MALYTVKIDFTPTFLETYDKIKNFEVHYKEKLMKAQALPEDSDADKEQKKTKLAELEVEYNNISAMLFNDDGYDVYHFHNEVILVFNTYAKGHKRTYAKVGETTDYSQYSDTFTFEDNFSPMFVFTQIAKIYPKFLTYLSVYTLSSEDGTLLVDFKNLQESQA